MQAVLILIGLVLIIVPTVPTIAADCNYMVCNPACKCLDNVTVSNETQKCTNTIYYSYESNITAELYIGGYIFFPKTIADRIKTSGGVVENETDCGWEIKVTQNAVTVQFVKLTDGDFSYGTKTFTAKEYPAEQFKPVTPDEMRMKLIELNESISNLSKEVKSIKTDVKIASSKPTFSEELTAFLFYFPPMWVVYTFLGVIAFISLLGWWYARD